MNTNSRKNRTVSRGITLVEILLALAIVVIVVVAIVPQIRTLRMSWAYSREKTDLIENSQALSDHITLNLMRARRVVAVSEPNNDDGFIEFMDSNSNIFRYEVGDNNFVEYGPPGDLSEVAGPVDILRFTCYDAVDLNTPITDVDYIRSVEVLASLPNPRGGPGMNMSAWAYIRTNYLSAELVVSAEYLFDGMYCRAPVIAKVDDEHFLCAYEKPSNVYSDGRGCAVVLMPRYVSDAWQITKGSSFIFDWTLGQLPELCQIDATHYLCAYRGPNTDGWAVVLIVNPGTWTVSKATAFEFADATGLPVADGGTVDIDTSYRSDLVKIDATHYLCAYMGQGFDGYAVVLTVNPSTYAISAGTPFEFDVADGRAPALEQIDHTHYLCVYEGTGGAGKAIVLEVNTGTWTITKKTPFMFSPVRGAWPDLSKIDDEHYLCAYSGPDDDGWAVVLNVNTTSWMITKNTPYEFDPMKGQAPELRRVDALNHVCSYQGEYGQENEAFDLPATVLLHISMFDWSVHEGLPMTMYGSDEGDTPDIDVINDTTFFSVYDGAPWQGNAVVLEVDLAIKP